jgi:nucleoside-diphosphate-sugar epimerase
MSKRIFLAGAAGAIGRRLAPLLVEAGYSVIGTTRSPEKAEDLRALGVEPVIVDVFDADALARIVVNAKPDVVIHQLTDLPASVDPAKAAEFAARNARIRGQGTDNLVKAALASGARRMIAQSIAWTYAPGGEPHDEQAPLDLDALEPRRTSVNGVVALETKTLQSPPLTGIVLRYGRIYGPGTGGDAANGSITVHVDAAAHAALLAVERGEHGIFNIAEPSGELTSAKAVRTLGWSPAFRLAK